MKADDPTEDLLRQARQHLDAGRNDAARELLEDIYWSQDSVAPEVAVGLCEIALGDANLEAAVYWVSELVPHVNRPGTGASVLLDAPLRRAARSLPLREQATWCERLERLFPGHPGVRRASRRVLQERCRLHKPVLQQSKGLRRQGRHADAARIVDDALARWPDDAWLLNELAQVRFEEGRIDEAATLHTRALEARPNDACAANNLAKIALSRGDVLGARDWFLSVLDGHPSDLHAMLGLGKCALIEGDEDAARPWFERILKIRPDDPAARMELRLMADRRQRSNAIEQSRTLRHRGMHDEARRALLGALELDVTAADVLHELGITCLERGRLDEAEGWFSRALRHDPDHAASAEALARVRTNEEAPGTQEAHPATGNPIEIAVRLWPGHDAVLNELQRPPDDDFAEPPAPFRIGGELNGIRPPASQRAGLPRKSPRRSTSGATALPDPDQLLALGRQSALAGRLDEADGWLSRAVEAAPDLPGPLVAAGDLARMRCDLPRARRFYRQALQASPSYKGALIGHALVEMKRRHFREARSWLETVLDRDPADARACAAMQRLLIEEEVLKAVGRSRSQRSQGALDPARKGIARAMQTLGEHPDLLVEAALVAGTSRDGRFAAAGGYSQQAPGAADLLRRALLLEPDNQAALNLLAVCHLEAPKPGAEDLRQAERLLRRALGARSDNTVTLANLGRLELARNRPAGAAGWYRQVLALVPDSPRALEGLGESAFRQGRLEEARQWFEKAWWAEDKDRPRLLTALARVCTALGDTVAARHHLAAALDLAPHDVRVMTSLAYVALLERDTAQARQWLTQAAERRPDDERVLNLLGRVAQAEGDYAQARRLYAETLSFHPASVRSFLGLAWTAYEEHNLPEALHWFAQALRIEPENPHALTGSGLVKARMGEYDEAQECYRASLRQGLHAPALWHWFRMATLDGRVQQLAWYLDKAASGNEPREVRAEVSAWKERMALGTRLRKEGGDVKAFLAQVARSLPRRYRATTPDPFPA